jgi:hypothetical protein
MSAAAIGQALVGAGTALTNHLLAREQTKLQREFQRHKNAVLGLNANLQRDALELKEIDARQADRDLSEQIQMQGMAQKAQAEVSAAAAGVTGGSVEAVMTGLERSAMRAQAARMENTSSLFRQLGQQRRDINVGQILGEDRTVIPGPSVGSLLLSMGTSALQGYGSQKEFGSKLLNSFFTPKTEG